MKNKEKSGCGYCGCFNMFLPLQIDVSEAQCGLRVPQYQQEVREVMVRVRRLLSLSTPAQAVPVPPTFPPRKFPTTTRPDTVRQLSSVWPAGSVLFQIVIK